MHDDELGMDRTVAATWPPDDTWPAVTEDLADDDVDEDVDGGWVAGASALEGAHADAGGGAAAGEAAVIDESDSSDIDKLPDADGVEAVAAIEGHPLHPALVPLPIGSFVGAFLCDLAYARSHDRFWARGARLLTGAGIVTGLAVAVLAVTGWLGGELAFRHRIGVTGR